MNDMTPDTREPRNFTRRRVLSAAGAGLAIGALGGIVAISGESNPPKVAAVSPSPEPTKTPPPSPEPTKTPPPSPEPTKTPEILAAKIEGLRFDPTTKKYFAEAGNPYGLEVNAYAGEFKSNVRTSNEKTGGLVLVSPVVSKILQDKIASIPDQKDKWMIALPVDIRNLDEKENVNVFFENGGVNKNIPIVTMEFKGILPLINIIPESQRLRVVKSPAYGWGYLNPDRLVQPYFERIYPGREMMYITVGGRFKGFIEEVTINSKFGDRIGEVDGSLIVSLTSSTQWYDVKPDKLLAINKTPIFIASNNP